MIKSDGLIESGQITKKNEGGFTLIELSIVLVIIGLIIGGILVGQDLIRAAEIRATVAQIEKYNSAVNTFRTKYNGIPGDLACATATAFNLYYPTAASTCGNAGYGDGNGLIEGGATGASSLLGETAEFWTHLSQAGYVDGSFGTGNNGMGALTTAAAIASSATDVYQVNSYIPPAKLGRGNSITVASGAGNNYFWLGGWQNIANTGVYSTTLNTNNLTPVEAMNIDKKTDDGLPLTGAIQAFNAIANSGGTAGFVGANITSLLGSSASGTALYPTSGAAGVSGCMVTGGTGYNISGTNGTAQGGSATGCALFFRFN
jgi:prepilin-type N-terminal cleavage/methylation domain-containing protein